MENNAFEETLVEALEALENGDQVEDVLGRYPEHSADLRQVMETTAQLAQLPLTSSAEAQQASKQAFLARAEQMKQGNGKEGARPLLRFILSFASLALALIIVALFASQQAIPGDPLYGFKRSVEDVRLSLASPAQEEQLRRAFEEERNREVYRMLDRGRDGVAGYTGIVEEIGEEQWELGNITIHITEDTVIQGTPEEGDRVEAHCRIEDGEVYAESLVVLDGD
jgi:hypothetical protein